MRYELYNSQTGEPIKEGIGGHPFVRKVGNPTEWNPPAPGVYLEVIYEDAPEAPEGKMLQRLTTVDLELGAKVHGWALVDRPVVVPSEVTKRQLRAWLIENNYDQAVIDKLNSMTNKAGKRARNDWESASVYERNNLLVKALATFLGLTEQQTDTAFIEADQL